jgi:hypothetical protein
VKRYSVEAVTKVEVGSGRQVVRSQDEVVSVLGGYA